MDNNKPSHSDLMELKQTLQEKLDALYKQVERTKRDYESVVNTLQLLGYKQIVGPTLSTIGVFQAVGDTGYKGLTQAQALEKIARENGGRFRMKDAKRILVAAGLIKTAKNANNILHNVVQREEGKFRRVAPGEYELVA
jgi:hypothetical protein